MSTTIHLVTADELLRMPDDGFRYELVKGELRKMCPAGHEHGRVAMRFAIRIGTHVEDNDLGVVYAAETGFLLSSDPDTVRAPDVAFVRKERVENVGRGKGYWPGPPDLAVEVISPGDTHAEVEEKAIDWLIAGAAMVLTFNPNKRTVTVYRSLKDIIILGDNDVLDCSDVVSGFKVAIKDIFD